MCAIIASFGSDKFYDLIKINQHRGNFSYSFMCFNHMNFTYELKQNFGEFNVNICNCKDYKIGHIQAPTQGLEKNKEKIHPSIINNSFLYHNGIIKTNEIKRLKEKYKISEEWDTKILHILLENYGFEILNEIDGSFACLYFSNNTLYLFRTPTVTLYIDDSLNISSSAFENSELIKENIVFSINFEYNTIDTVSNFQPKSDPYFII